MLLRGVVVLCVIVGIGASSECDEGCPSTAPTCCVMLDGTSMCCPRGTRCDAQYGCVLSQWTVDSSATDSSTGSTTTVKNAPLHESITSVYVTIFAAVKFLVYVGILALLLCVAAYIHRSLLIRYSEWKLRRLAELERVESSDEEVAEVQLQVSEGATSDDCPGDGEGSCLRCNGPIDCVLLRCGHASICYNCSRMYRECPKCGEKIHRRQRLFVV